MANTYQGPVTLTDENGKVLYRDLDARLYRSGHGPRVSASKIHTWAGDVVLPDTAPEVFELPPLLVHVGEVSGRARLNDSSGTPQTIAIIGDGDVPF